MTQITTWNLSSDVSDMLQSLSRDGAIVIEGACSGQKLNEELHPYFEAVGKSKGHFYGFETKRLGSLISKSALCRDLSMNSVIIDLVKGVLGSYCDRIQLNLTQGIEIRPGENAQFLHRDDDLFPFEKSFDSMVNVMWAATDFTTDNGGTRYILGSHKWDRTRQPAMGETQSIELKAGSCFVYLGSLLHAGGANTTGKSRRGAVIGYNLGWLRQAENFFLSVPWDTAKTFPDQLLRLMGYQLHRPNIGWVEGVDPLEWIRAGRPSICPAKDALTPDQMDIAAAMIANPEAFRAYLT